MCSSGKPNLRVVSGRFSRRFRNAADQWTLSATRCPDIGWQSMSGFQLATRVREIRLKAVFTKLIQSQEHGAHETHGYNRRYRYNCIPTTSPPPRQRFWSKSSWSKGAATQYCNRTNTVRKSGGEQRGAPQIGGYGGDPPLKYRFREGRRTFLARLRYGKFECTRHRCERGMHEAYAQ